MEFAEGAVVRADAKVKPDSRAARVVRFLVGSIFGLTFIGFCFVMLTVSLKGPDTIQVAGSTNRFGLLQAGAAERLAIGNPAPDFALEQLGGEPVQLSKLRGKIVLVNFWASWCDPCREEMPDIQKFYVKHKSEDVVVLTVNVKESDDVAKSYFKTNSLNMPVLMDRTGDVPGGYRATAYPESYFVDKAGKIGEFNIGPMTFEQMEAKLLTIRKAAGE